KRTSFIGADTSAKDEGRGNYNHLAAFTPGRALCYSRGSHRPSHRSARGRWRMKSIAAILAVVMVLGALPAASLAQQPQLPAAPPQPPPPVLMPDVVKEAPAPVRPFDMYSVGAGFFTVAR